MNEVIGNKNVAYVMVQITIKEHAPKHHNKLLVSNLKTFIYPVYIYKETYTIIKCNELMLCSHQGSQTWKFSIRQNQTPAQMSAIGYAA